jgi:NhaA family Na+:H+ antiporter
MSDRDDRTLAPGTWEPARRTVERLFEPIDRFLHVEAASGIVLLAATFAALVWANSPWGWSYDWFWKVPITLGAASYTFTHSLHFWIDEGLMTIFFLVVGLEIRREIHSGELSEWKRASLPLAAALGGMLAPALFYWVLNRGTVVQQGWAVPMATDIAFAVGVLALLGRRVPPALRVLLLALAIIDDIGAVLVIAVAFSTGISTVGLLVACAGIGGVLALQKLGARRVWAYAVPGMVIWIGLLRAGIHPSMAGVILGLSTPARSWFGEHGFLAATQRALAHVETLTKRPQRRPEDLLGPLRKIETARREALAPVVRIQSKLHGWVAFGVMPLFALANAGVHVAGLEFGDRSTRLASLGIAAGLLLGKPLGISLATLIAIRLRWSALPRGIGWPAIAVLGCVGGIGFTMSIFVADLAFAGSPALAEAKLAVLAGSFSSAVVGLVLGRFALTPVSDPRAAKTATEAEHATEA